MSGFPGGVPWPAPSKPAGPAPSWRDRFQLAATIVLVALAWWVIWDRHHRQAERPKPAPAAAEKAKVADG